MKQLGIALLLISSSAFASSNGYEMMMDLSLDGNPSTSAHVTAQEGKVALVTQKTDSGETFLEIIATEGKSQDHSKILMKFIVGTIAKNGKRTILARPQVIVRDGEPARISQNDEKTGEEYLSLSIIAKRTTL